MITVKYEDLSGAFDFVSSAAPFEHRAFLSRDTGAIYWVSEIAPVDEEELPDDLETSDSYLEIPHKNDFDLGNALAFRFADEWLPHRSAEVAACFRRRGAYACFKELLAADGCLEKWYAFEAEQAERALREWCHENRIRVIDDGTAVR
jgi:hypothetical protein